MEGVIIDGTEAETGRHLGGKRIEMMTDIMTEGEVEAGVCKKREDIVRTRMRDIQEDRIPGLDHTLVTEDAETVDVKTLVKIIIVDLELLSEKDYTVKEKEKTREEKFKRDRLLMLNRTLILNFDPVALKVKTTIRMLRWTDLIIQKKPH